MASNPQNAPAAGHTAQPVELAKIHVDYAWNGRSVKNVQDIASVESTGFAGFISNIRTAGQISPVILRNTNGKTLSGQKTEKPFELMVGFRRYRAVELANQENEDKKRPAVPNLPNGTILAETRNITDPTEARVLNALENTARKNLKAPDLVFIARDLAAKGLAQVPIADALQITQGWVSKLLKVAGLPQAVLDNWRDDKPIPAVQTKDGVFELKAEGSTGKAPTSRELTEPEMRALAELKGTPEELTARYIRMVAPASEPGEGPGGSTAGETDKVKAEVKAIAGLMGCMVRAGVLDSGSLNWTLVIGPKKKGYPIDCGKDTSQERLLDLNDAAQEVYEAEVSKGAKGKTA